MRRYFIKTYGCQMNLADSSRLAAVLNSFGCQDIMETKFGETDKSEAGTRKAEERILSHCDIVIVNSCSVRQNAEDKAVHYARSLKYYKKHNPDFKIIFCGCSVPANPGLKDLLPHVDLFLPPNSPEKLNEYLNLSFVIGHSSLLSHPRNAAKYITIMHGCDNYCSYCIVPYVRGREVSRPMDEVLAEIKTLLDNGAKEITLLGQNVNSYKYGLANLLNNLPSLVIGHLSLVIKFLTSHPKDLSDEIIETVAKLPFVSKEFHFPLQSGDDEILKKMNRGYTFAYYLNRVEKIRFLMPRARITTDLIVGFPGETEEQFQNTLLAVKKIKFRECFMFAYSKREKTAAAKLPGQVPEEVKQRRLKELIKIVREVVARSRQEC